MFQSFLNALGGGQQDPEEDDMQKQALAGQVASGKSTDPNTLQLGGGGGDTGAGLSKDLPAPSGITPMAANPNASIGASNNPISSPYSLNMKAPAPATNVPAGTGSAGKRNPWSAALNPTATPPVPAPTVGAGSNQLNVLENAETPSQDELNTNDALSKAMGFEKAVGTAPGSWKGPVLGMQGAIQAMNVAPLTQRLAYYQNLRTQQANMANQAVEASKPVGVSMYDTAYQIDPATGQYVNNGQQTTQGLINLKAGVTGAETAARSIANSTGAINSLDGILGVTDPLVARMKASDTGSQLLNSTLNDLQSKYASNPDAAALATQLNSIQGIMAQIATGKSASVDEVNAYKTINASTPVNTIYDIFNKVFRTDAAARTAANAKTAGQYGFTAPGGNTPAPTGGPVVNQSTSGGYSW